MRDDHVRLFLESQRAYGDVVRFRLGPELIHLVAHPTDIRTVLIERQANFPKTKFNKRIECFLGKGLLTSMGEHWRKQRRMIQPAFHREKLDRFTRMVVGETRAMLDRWSETVGRGEVIDVAVEMRKLNLEIIGKAMFGTSFIADASVIDRAFEVCLSALTHRLSAPIPFPTFVPTPQNIRLNRALGVIEPIIRELIAERRKSNEDRGDLISMLLAARDEETGQGMTDREIRDEVVTMILAGYDSPSTALAWTLMLLAKHPAAQDRVREEANRLAAGDDLNPMAVRALEYTAMTYHEAMRICAPAGNIGRDAAEDDEIGGYHIPAGSTVVMNAYVTHRHPEFWPDPETFVPERFAEAEVAKRPRGAYLPFGEGPRKCIGANFNVMMAPLMAAMIVRAVRFIDVPDQVVELEPMMTYRPKHGIKLRLERP